MKYHFFAMISRMKFIERWALMRNARKENLSEHSMEVAMIAHALAVISKVRLNKEVDENKVALIAMYHDATEIITGDMPTPIKYYNAGIQNAYKEIEHNAAERLLNMLPQDLRPSYETVFFRNEGEDYLWKLVKAADKISALIKCIEESKAGNKEFSSAKKSILKSIEAMDLEEANIFLKEFLPSYEKNLDELQ